MQLERQRQRRAGGRTSIKRTVERNFRDHLAIQPLHFTIQTPYHVSHTASDKHGRRDSLHVFPPPNGPPAPGDRSPIHALLHQHIMSRRARGYVQEHIKKYTYTSLTTTARPQPRRLAHRPRLIPSTQPQVAAPTQGVQSLPPHKLPQSRAPLPYSRLITPQADRRETHPGCCRTIREAPLRAQSAILRHQDSQQALAHLHAEKGRRKQARDSGEEG